MASTAQQETDTLTHLEERIQRAVLLVLRLREEKEAALKAAADVQLSLDESEKNNARLTEEVESLRSERHLVKGRLEKLLGQIDQLSAV